MRISAFLFLGLCFLGLSGCDSSNSPAATPTAYNKIRLKWNADQSDLDLYVRSSSGEQVWVDASGRKGSFGEIDKDEEMGYGPETFSLYKTAPADTYTVWVNYHNSSGFTGSITATVEYFPWTPTNTGAVWTVADTKTFQFADQDSTNDLTPLNPWILKFELKQVGGQLTPIP